MNTADAILIQPVPLSGWSLIVLAVLCAAMATCARLQATRLRRERDNARSKYRAAEATTQALRAAIDRQVANRTRSLQSRNDDLLRQRRALITANLRLARLASHDALTGLANRRRFDHALEQQLRSAVQRQQPLSLIFLDLDGFKRFNDLHGHGRGDEVLRTVAHALQATCQRTDALVARHGGEEFAVLLPGLGARHARSYAEKLRRSVWRLGIASHCPLVEDLDERVTISAGVITLSASMLNRTAARPAQLATLMQQSVDQALYRAKSQGRNRIVIATGWSSALSDENPPAAQGMELAS